MPFPTSVFVRSGKYSLISPEPIGVGGLGRIYQARDTGLDQVVAVKEILPTLHPSRRQQAVEKLPHEARLHAALRHECIVQARTLESDPETGEQYLVCDFIAGGSLADQLRGGPLHPAAALRVALDLLAALEYLHERLVIHRDIKPSNILLVKDAHGQIVKALLADLGIARNLRVAPSTIGPGAVPSLTPEYCAPEQINPANMLDPRVDLYALGLVLGEMLIGEGPYKLALRRVQVGHTRPPVGDRATRALFAIVARATRDAPEERYQSATAFRSALQAAARRFRPAAAAPSRSFGAVLVMLSLALFLLLAPLLLVLGLQQQAVAERGPVAPSSAATPSSTSAPLATPAPRATPSPRPGVVGFAPNTPAPSAPAPSRTPTLRAQRPAPSAATWGAPLVPTVARPLATQVPGTPVPDAGQPTLLVPW